MQFQMIVGMMLQDQFISIIIVVAEISWIEPQSNVINIKMHRKSHFGSETDNQK